MRVVHAARKGPSATAAGGRWKEHEVFEREVSATGGKREPAMNKEAYYAPGHMVKGKAKGHRRQ